MRSASILKAERNFIENSKQAYKEPGMGERSGINS